MRERPAEMSSRSRPENRRTIRCCASGIAAVHYSARMPGSDTRMRWIVLPCYRGSGCSSFCVVLLVLIVHLVPAQAFCQIKVPVRFLDECARVGGTVGLRRCT